MKTKKNIMEILKHVYLLIITFIVLTPIYYLLVTTFKSGTEAAAKPMALPSSWDITPYINAFEKMQYPRAFGNTLIITVCAVFGIVMSSTMCGYVLNRKEKSKITKIIFACDAGMGSSAFGASILRKKAKEMDLSLEVTNQAIRELSADKNTVVVTQNELLERAKKMSPEAQFYPVDKFLPAEQYDKLLEKIKNQ